MTDRPILFSAPIVRALLDGSKTQTRRILKPQPETFDLECGNECLVYPLKVEGRDYTNIAIGHETSGVITKQKMPFEIGDRLWVRETWCLCGQMNKFPPRDVSPFEPVGYLADGDIRVMSCEMLTRGKTRVSIHMPRWASRLTLIVTDVRIQRLQDISEDDAIAEGIGMTSGTLDLITGSAYFNYENEAKPTWLNSPIDSFHTLWNSINGPIAWDQNPWVVATTFETHKINIDQMGAA